MATWLMIVLALLVVALAFCVGRIYEYLYCERKGWFR